MNPRVALFSACLPGWSAREVTAAAQRCGFAAIEWGFGPGQAIADVASAAEACALAAHAGLGCAGLAVQDPEVSLATPDRAAVAVELAISLAAPHVRVSAPRYSGDSDSLSVQQQRARDGLARLVELGSPANVSVLVETSPTTLAPTPDLAFALVEDHAATAAGVLYDPGNMIIEGHTQPDLAVERLNEYLAHVHVKNIVWRRRDGAWRWQYSSLAAGMADWPSIMQALAGTGYRGRFSMDHLAGRPTEKRLRDEVETLDRLIEGSFKPGQDRPPRPTPLPAARSRR
jgi:sugar phosphate isomerase/epimerase